MRLMCSEGVVGVGRYSVDRLESNPGDVVWMWWARDRVGGADRLECTPSEVQ